MTIEKPKEPDMSNEIPTPDPAAESKVQKLSSTARFTIGVSLMLLSGLGFAVQGLFVNLAGDLPSEQKTFFRYVVVFIVSFFYLWRTRSRNRRNKIQNTKLIKNKGDLGWLIVRSTLGTLGVLANFYVLDLIPIGNAQMLNKLSPFFTIIFSSIFLNERVNKVQAAGIVTAFIGVVVLLDPDASGISTEYLFPIIIGILGGLAAGAAYTTIRHLGARGMEGSFIVFFFAGFGMLSLVPLVIANYVPMTGMQWLYMLLLGLGAVAGQYGITYAYHFAEPRRISIFDYSAVVFAMILGALFLDQIPDRASIIGSIIIFLAFLMMFVYNRFESRRAARAK